MFVMAKKSLRFQPHPVVGVARRALPEKNTPCLHVHTLAASSLDLQSRLVLGVCQQQAADVWVEAEGSPRASGLHSSRVGLVIALTQP